MKKTEIANAFDNLDGTLLNVDVKSIKTQNINDYFLGFIGVALGIVSILYGLLQYAEFFTTFRFTTEG